MPPSTLYSNPVPSAGELTATVPVATAQVGTTVLFTVGAVGAVGTALIVTVAAAGVEHVVSVVLLTRNV